MFPTSPIKDTTYTVNGIEYIYDGNGFVPKGKKEEKPQETDPIYSQEKDQFIKRSELPSSGVAMKSDMPDFTRFATKEDIPVVDNFALKSQHADTYFRKDVEYEGDYIKLKNIGTSKLYKVKKLIVRTSYGDKVVDSKVVFNNGYCHLFSEFLSRATNWELFTIEYDIVDNIRTYPPDLKGKIGRNFMQDEDAGNTSHSSMCAKVFKSVHSQFSTADRQALESIVVEGSSIEQEQTDEMAVKHKFNILARPYGNGVGSIGEETSSCPDILTVGSHWGNYFYAGAIAERAHNKTSDSLPNTGDRKDITNSETEFLNNTIAVTAGQSLDGTGRWCSYGYGVEFFEAYNVEDMDAQFPEKNYYSSIAGVTIPDARTIKASGTHKILNWNVGDSLFLHYSTENIVEFKIAEIISETEVKSDRDLPIQTEMIYVWGYITLGRLFGDSPQQSATCSMVAAKLAAIQDHTDANWQIVREAARKTASNATVQYVGDDKVYIENWDMRRGFGRINVAHAVQYIKEKYSENQEYLDSVIPQLPRYNPFLKLDDIDDENPVTKKMVKELPAKVKGLESAVGDKANTNHTHITSEITDLSKRKNLLIATKPIIVAGRGVLNQLAPFYEVVNGILNKNTSIGETLFLSYKYILEGNTQETNLGTHYWRCKTNDDLGWTNIISNGKKAEIFHEEVNVVKEINISFIVDDRNQVITEFGARLGNIPTDLTFKMWDVFLYKKNTDWIPESEDKESIRHIHEISDIVGLDDALTRLENKESSTTTEIINIKDGAALQMWVGTQTEYDAITTKSESTIYIIQ